MIDIPPTATSQDPFRFCLRQHGYPKAYWPRYQHRYILFWFSNMRCQLIVSSPAHAGRLLDYVLCCSGFRYPEAHIQMENQSSSSTRRRLDNPITGKLIVCSLERSLTSSQLMGIGNFAFDTWAVRFGLGRHFFYLTPSERVNSMKGEFLGQPIGTYIEH
jgi:hypothetical protein